jgi:group I intron endonuclease
MFIYRITNSVTQNFYIGKTTKTIEERFQRHKYNAEYGSQSYIHRSMRKYGYENFTIEIIEQTDNLNERECYWIEKLSPKYNMTYGGDGGDTSSSLNFINAMKNRKHPHNPTYGMLGKCQTENQKQKVSSKNSHPIICEGKFFKSIKDAETAYPNIKVRYRLDSPKYPNYYRLREKRKINQL